MPELSVALAQAISRTARRYRGASRFGQAYVAGKLRFDPLYHDLLALPAPNFGEVLDIGCGRGQLGILLIEAGAAHSVLGIDRQGRLLREAQRAGADVAFDVERRDLVSQEALPVADTVFLIDVLYQLDTARQNAVLHRAAAAARQRIIIRTGDPSRGWRSALTCAVERVGRRIWPHSGATVNQPSVNRLVSALSAAGFSTSTQPCWRGTPFCNVLIDGRR